MNSLPGLAQIEQERYRQRKEEGWGEEHDDQHEDYELEHAGRHYHGYALRQIAGDNRDGGVPIGWPWARDWWKPKDVRRNLVRAGALYQAEMERLTRRLVMLEANRDECARLLDEQSEEL